jgi:hypothetical protein
VPLPGKATEHLTAPTSISCCWLLRGLAAIGSKSSRSKLQDDEKTVTLQVGKSVFADAPRNMRTELWMSSLQRKGIGVAASQRYQDMLQMVSQHAAVLPHWTGAVCAMHSANIAAA